MPAGMKTASNHASPDPVAVPARPVDLALARIHLRLGSLALASVELEILAGQGALDVAGQVDLAEVRWRTGDLSGAGEAASVVLAAGEEDPMALAIAAEAAAALGRPNEARRLASRAMEGIEGPIDALFAGMPRAGVWPADAADPPPTAGTLFHDEPGHPEPAASPRLRAGETDPGVTASRSALSGEPLGPTTGAPLTVGFWDGDGSAHAAAPGLPDPAHELEAGRAALVAGALDEATLRFGLALRLAPSLAPAILEATDGVSGAAIHVVRGDAYRLVGLESEARRAYAAAAWSGSRDRRGRPAGSPSPDEGPATPESSGT